MPDESKQKKGDGMIVKASECERYVDLYRRYRRIFADHFNAVLNPWRVSVCTRAEQRSLTHEAVMYHMTRNIGTVRHK